MIDEPLTPLVDAAREGDDRAVADLVRRTQPAVWRLCTYLGAAGEEDDLVQETFVRALRGLDSYRGDAPFQSWVLAIARRVCADFVRKRQRERRLVDTLRSLRPTTESAAHESVDDLLIALAPERREAFVLTQIIGLSYDEAAAVADCPVGTIRSRVARARAELLSAIDAAEAI